eukprot:259359-Chlamydomonas_euryale.AAC.2
MPVMLHTCVGPKTVTHGCATPLMPHTCEGPKRVLSTLPCIQHVHPVPQETYPCSKPLARKKSLKEKVQGLPKPGAALLSKGFKVYPNPRRCSGKAGTMRLERAASLRPSRHTGHSTRRCWGPPIRPHSLKSMWCRRRSPAKGQQRRRTGCFVEGCKLQVAGFLKVWSLALLP